VAGLDALGLAPARVQQEVAAQRQRAAHNEAVWEALMATSAVGGGGTFVSSEVACPSCGEQRAQVHTILSGGTYAQERVQIQKYVCQACSHTWRSDD
jgi:transposase-like protein